MQNYSLQSNRKTEEGADHPDRDAQFRHINAQVKRALATGMPVISVDTKKKELLGNYDNGGQQWLPAKSPLSRSPPGMPGGEYTSGLNQNSAYACQRPIHAHSRTVASAKGSSRLFCCPACALSEQRQEGKAVRVTELTAFMSGAKLSPNDAYVVQAHELIDADKRPADVHYDRCAPSLLAFAQEREAIQFSGEHGGTVLPFREVAASFAKIGY